MRQVYKKKIREFYDDGFSVEELAIMYRTSRTEVTRSLEEDGVIRWYENPTEE